MAVGLRPPEDGDKDATKQGVCFIQSPNGVGSGLLVAWRKHPCVLTNNHVIDREVTAKKAQALFGYSRRSNKDSAAPAPMLSEPGDLFFTSPFKPPLDSKVVDADHLDYSLIQVDDRGLPRDVEPLTLWPGYDARQPDWRNGTAWVVGHPDGGPRVTPQGGLREGPDEFTAEHMAFTEGGSSGSPVFLHAGDVPLLGVHYWGERTQPGRFVRLPAIVTDVLKQEITRRAGTGYDPSNADHVAAVTFIASSLAALPTQARAHALPARSSPSGLPRLLMPCSAATV